MELTPAELDELLGAWALDALDPDEHRRVEAMLDHDSALARQATALRQAVVALDIALGSDPPEELRSNLLARTRVHPRPTPEAADPLTVFANQVAALERLLATITGDEWDRPAHPYRWTVHGLVAHLLVIERYTGFKLGLGEQAPSGVDAHLEIGVEEIDHELRGPADRTALAWSAVARTTIDRLRTGDHGPRHDPIDFHGWPFTADSLLIARGFEIWTHADDIRRATGRPVGAPDPAELRTMARFSVSSLPLVLPLVAPERQLTGARVVLTGDGGGTFDLGDPDRRATLLVVDVVDYCRLAARRIPVDELAHEIEGDPALARELLAAAQVFAV